MYYINIILKNIAKLVTWKTGQFFAWGCCDTKEKADKEEFERHGSYEH